MDYYKLRNQIIKELKNILTPKEFAHSLGVEAECVKLAYLTKNEKMIRPVSIAALIHDYAKCMPIDVMLKNIEKHKIKIKNKGSKISSRGLLHGHISAHFAITMFKIRDMKIINAIKHHTTGRPRMNIIEKILFIADFIEPTRDFKEVSDIRKTVYDFIIRENSINKALKAVMTNKIKYLEIKNIAIDADTKKTYESLDEFGL
ncbi:MAG: bis(5'-nucleosyl)-tetraphosphatase (symmetrical) YqeK [Candidatus Wallbacteria bacterium]